MPRFEAVAFNHCTTLIPPFQTISKRRPRKSNPILIAITRYHGEHAKMLKGLGCQPIDRDLPELQLIIRDASLEKIFALEGTVYSIIKNIKYQR